MKCQCIYEEFPIGIKLLTKVCEYHKDSEEMVKGNPFGEYTFKQAHEHLERLKSMYSLKLGDFIEWKLDNPIINKRYGTDTYEAQIDMIDEENKWYGVHAVYGQDLIPFDQATFKD